MRPGHDKEWDELIALYQGAATKMNMDEHDIFYEVHYGAPSRDRADIHAEKIAWGSGRGDGHGESVSGGARREGSRTMGEIDRANDRGRFGRSYSSSARK